MCPRVSLLPRQLETVYFGEFSRVSSAKVATPAYDTAIHPAFLSIEWTDFAPVLGRFATPTPIIVLAALVVIRVAVN